MKSHKTAIAVSAALVVGAIVGPAAVDAAKDADRKIRGGKATPVAIVGNLPVPVEVSNDVVTVNGVVQAQVGGEVRVQNSPNGPLEVATGLEDRLDDIENALSGLGGTPAGGADTEQCDVAGEAFPVTSCDFANAMLVSSMTAALGTGFDLDIRDTTRMELRLFDGGQLVWETRGTESTHFTFPVPIRADRAQVRCHDSAGTCFVDAFYHGRSLGAG